MRSKLLVFAAMCAAACSAPPVRSQAPEPAAVDASVVRVSMADLPVQLEAGGVVRARLTAVVSSRILAPILEIRVRPGDRVTRGEPLVVLDGRELRAQAARAEAALDAAGETAHAAAADEQAADAGVALARATHERVSTLHASRSATAQELDEAIAALKAAEARSSGARAHAREAAAALTAARAAVEAANISASYASLTAPFDGTVAERSVDPGTVAAPGVPLLTVEEAGGFRLETRLDEARLAYLAVGQPARVRLDAADVPAGGATERWLDGRIAEIARVDAAQHSFAVKIDLPPDPSVRSGLFGRAVFRGPTRRTLAAPSSAIVQRGQLTFVFVAADGVARLRSIAAGRTVDNQTEILAGVADGEPVVVAPPPSLTDGMRLRTRIARDEHRVDRAIDEGTGR